MSAARLGCRVALINDRPVVGGNNSSEIRVHLGGRIEEGLIRNLAVCRKNLVRKREEMHNQQNIMKTRRKWIG